VPAAALLRIASIYSTTSTFTSLSGTVRTTGTTSTKPSTVLVLVVLATSSQLLLLASLQLLAATSSLVLLVLVIVTSSTRNPRGPTGLPYPVLVLVPVVLASSTVLVLPLQVLGVLVSQ
jgi:hypothetical protein